MIISDLLIIGAGPGGYETAAGAAAKGLKVTLFERDLLGGTCLNRGCIPTKTLCHAAETAATIREAAEYGVGGASPSIDFTKLMTRKNEVVNRLREGVGMTLAKVNVVTGEARFTAPHTVEANGESYTAPRIIIATGSAPSISPIPGAEKSLNSNDLLSLSELPKSIIIIGGGVIGMEFASIFNALGSIVTVIEYCKEILPQFDKDIAKRLRTSLSAAGVTFFTSAEVKEVSDGRIVKFIHKGEEKIAEAETVAIATGRRPVVPEGLETAGIEVTRKGIAVDLATFETSAEGVYAIGDVNGICMLAHAASAQGAAVLGDDINLNVIPSAVFTIPEAAMVGMTEEQCKAAGTPYKVSKALFRANGKAVSMGRTEGLVKLITEAESGKILGCHILGPHAADLIHEPALAMSAGLPATAISSTVHAHPTLAEVMAAAAH